ncbi:MAG: DUF624 domain-containing protein [Defluviitaleaceae bacterium]|nr:DUF624 domain-containing protein [Defluviitaleaceae bacterium]
MLSSEGKFYKIGSVLADIVIASILWIVFSLPIITIGAATTGLYYACTKKVSGKDGYFIQDFLNSFRENFKRATIVFLMLSTITFLIVFNIIIGRDMDLNIVVRIVQWFVLLQLIFAFMYAFALLSRFELTIIENLKAAFIMANKHMFTTLTNLGFLLAIALISIYFTIVTVFIMGLYIYLSSIFFVKIFRKHYPDFDKPVDGEIKPLKLDDR